MNTHVQLYETTKDVVNIYSVDFFADRTKPELLVVAGIVKSLLVVPLLSDKSTGNLLPGYLVTISDPVGEILLAILPQVVKVEDDKSLSDIVVGSRVIAKGASRYCNNTKSSTPTLYVQSIQIL